MSLARAMTKRMKRTEAPEKTTPSHSKSVKNPTLQIDRNQISLPIALLSTTNTLVYDAPDLASMDLTAMRNVSSPTSTHSSADDSDHSISGRSRASSQGSRSTLTDASSVGSSPTSPTPNHLSGYFPAPNGKQLRKSASTNSLSKVREEPTEPVPALPQRAVSHSKRAHVQLAQKRSMQNLSMRGASMSSLGSLGSVREQRSSLDIFAAATISEEAEAHPFGAELEQLNEAVEEFSGVARSAEEQADVELMQRRGLAAFCAAEYMAEIQPLFSALIAPPRMAWI
ncbi:uncharacterized protein EKO05_0002258 [Ascochyta rabiei]|uniref:Uncharacterized protein n=1 Tax=Didymella rabiei TaxID=5454 RepID=A0A163KSC9_DIDRA|nr:uncharacterized protein EKO05_0002258 [Ascochyta rabiei]KZM27214.1 hypothetical protein ST47_g1652 [Ascochyta rabiei]UPX11664.1 hypothetical protein EKO05_0002258 [Ascochyta rabiei]